MSVKSTLRENGKSYSFYSLRKVEERGLKSINRLPKSLKVLLENLLRHEGGSSVSWDDIKAWMSG